MANFIGEKEIKKLGEVDINGEVIITFKDKSTSKISEDLYNLIISERKQDGGITDAVRHRLATEFIARMSELGLNFYMVEHVTQGMLTLAHNMREKEMAKRFNCPSVLDIKLSDLIPE